MMLGDLHRWLMEPTRPLNWPLRLKIATDIAKGMLFLHSSTPPIVHRDLKTPNILVRILRACSNTAEPLYLSP